MFAKKSISRLFSLLFVFVFILSVTPFQAARAAGTRYAKPVASGTGECSSWTNACTLQSALTSAASGDELWVMAGTHLPTTGTDRSATFQLKNGVAVYGGFVGNETVRDQRNPALNDTILSGEIGAASNSDNSYHVVTGATGATLDGFTITAGNASGADPNNFGGGMWNHSSSPTLTNVIFSGNSANIGGGGMYNDNSNSILMNVTFIGNSAGWVGGGMYNYSSSPTLTNVTFSDNSGPKGGGGMYNYSSNPTLTNVTFSDNSAGWVGGGMENDQSSPTLTNVTFSGNSASQTGGGMFNYSSSNPTLMDVIFSGNTADDGGGGMANENSSPTLTNVTFSSNSAAVNGGGMENYSSSDPSLTNITFSSNSAINNGGGMYNVQSNPELTNVTFSGNTADSGGGMTNGASSPTLTNVTFSGNTATTHAGGMYNDQSSPTLTSVTFSANTADYGGGMFNRASSPYLRNVTFRDNWAGYDGGGMENHSDSNPSLTNVTFSFNGAANGGGMLNYQSSPFLTNVTFSENEADYNGGGMYNLPSTSIPAIRNAIFWGNSGIGGGAQIYNSGSIPVVSYSVVQDGCPSGSACTNLIITDPKLGTLGNYGGFTQTIPLLADSSAIDTGSDAIYVCPLTDQRGVARPQDGNFDGVAACDIGAYEFNGNLAVMIGGTPQEFYNLASGQSTRASYAGVNNGPVKIFSTGTPILAAQRLLYYGTGTQPTSFVEMMGLPASQLDTTYWFPWYKNDGIVDTQLRLGNVSASTATVHIFIAGVEVTGSPFTLTASGAGQSQRLSFALNDGPVKVVSNVAIVTTERLIYFDSGSPVSFSEMLGLPNSQLSTTWWFPWYKNVAEDIDTQLRIANVSGATATVHIFIAGVEVTGSPFTLTTSGAGQSQRLSFPVNAGPVKIVSDHNIVAAERLLYYAGGLPTSFVETMGIPNGQLSTTQWFPWYKNDGIVDTQLRIGNVSGVAASVHVYLGTTEMTGSPFALTATGAGQSLRLSFTANDGPVKLVSDQNIVAAERLIYFNSGVAISFSEMMGLPNSQLSATWWLPWYKNVGEIDTQLRFGVP